MTNKEITNAVAELYRTTSTLEELYIENGGEITEETAEKEDQVEAIKALLNGDGIDSLGRWMKAKEDERDTLKAEKAAIDRRLKAVNNTLDYIKFQVGQVLRATGCEKAKGLAYGFSVATSTKTAVNQEAIDADWLEEANRYAHSTGMPECITIQLKTTTTALKEWAANNKGQGLGYIDETTTETCRFTKPRAVKEDKKEE